MNLNIFFLCFYKEYGWGIIFKSVIKGNFFLWLWWNVLGGKKEVFFYFEFCYCYSLMGVFGLRDLIIFMVFGGFLGFED